MLRVVENVRRKQVAWVNAILDHKKWRPSRLAREAGIDHSTLSKFLNDPLNAAQLNTLSVEKIAAVVPFPPYQTQAASRPSGLAEVEAEPYDASTSDILRAAVDALRGGRNGLDAWILHSRALENAGYLPGDVLIVDLNAEPRSGDAVCAQIYDRNGQAETVMRLYEHPFLTSATNDKALMRPHLVDGDRVLLRGVITSSLRPRRAA